jgi:anti-anti-sigma regulatory factor
MNIVARIFLIGHLRRFVRYVDRRGRSRQLIAMTFRAPPGLLSRASGKESPVDLVIRTPFRPDVVCDLSDLVALDLQLVDALARLKLAVTRLGGDMTLQAPPVELLELIELAGLRDVLPVEPRRHPEQREEVRGVQEEDDPADPSVGDL